MVRPVCALHHLDCEFVIILQRLHYKFADDVRGLDSFIHHFYLESLPFDRFRNDGPEDLEVLVVYHADDDNSLRVVVPDHLPEGYDGVGHGVLGDYEFAETAETLDPGGVYVVGAVFARFRGQMHAVGFDREDSGAIFWQIHWLVCRDQIEFPALEICY